MFWALHFRENCVSHTHADTHTVISVPWEPGLGTGTVQSETINTQAHADPARPRASTPPHLALYFHHTRHPEPSASEPHCCQCRRWAVLRNRRELSGKSAQIQEKANNLYQSGFSQGNRATRGIMGKMPMRGIRVPMAVERAEKVNAGKWKLQGQGNSNLMTSAQSTKACDS